METLTYGKHRYSLGVFSPNVVRVCLNRGFCVWLLHEMLSMLPVVGTQCKLCWLLYLDHACFVETTQNFCRVFNSVLLHSRLLCAATKTC